ncbi:MAG: hypothetical protein HKO07_07140, partial [Pseudomonadales bacterium]|nr:hypothetical protein [Pseudomonadales bacterium]
MLGQAAAPVSASNYNDLSGLAQIKQLAGVNEGAAYEEIGKQFESLLLHAMLKGMRSANRVFSEGGLLSSNSVEFYENMLDDQMSLALADNGGMGIAKEFALQTRAAYNKDATQLQALPTARIPKAPSLEQNASVQPQPQSQSRLNRNNFIEHLMPFAQRAAAKLDVEPELL